MFAEIASVFSAVNAALGIGRSLRGGGGSASYQESIKDWEQQQERIGFENFRNDYEKKVKEFYEDYDEKLVERFKEEDDKFFLLYNKLADTIEQSRANIIVEKESMKEPFVINPAIVGIIIIILLIMVKL